MQCDLGLSAAFAVEAESIISVRVGFAGNHGSPLRMTRGLPRGFMLLLHSIR
jgi:hypothetical protein